MNGTKVRKTVTQPVISGKTSKHLDLFVGDNRGLSNANNRNIPEVHVLGGTLNGTLVASDNSDAVSTVESRASISFDELEWTKMIVLCIVMALLILTVSKFVLKVFSQVNGRDKGPQPIQ